MTLRRFLMMAAATAACLGAAVTAGQATAAADTATETADHPKMDIGTTTHLDGGMNPDIIAPGERETSVVENVGRTTTKANGGTNTDIKKSGEYGYSVMPADWRTPIHFAVPQARVGGRR